MRMSRFLFRSLRQRPSEADTDGHALLLRGGYVQQLAAGIFGFTPLGLRVLRRIERILREEMGALGVQEVSLPLVQPAELWRESGRWDEVGEEMARLADRGGRELCLAMTHEEAATWQVGAMVDSYRQLPVAVFQLQTKFRDEPRPRGGLIRVREFTMKDAYSFHADEADLDRFYEGMRGAYLRIFERCGLEVTVVESDQGMMGGSGAHEFMALTPIGEDTVLLCDRCDYRANRQVARSGTAGWEGSGRGSPGTGGVPGGSGTAGAGTEAGGASGEPPAPLEEVATPGAATIADLTALLGLPASRTAKAVLLMAELPAPAGGVDGRGEADWNGAPERLIFAVVRGDADLNEAKLANALGARRLRPATEEEIRRVGAEPGYASPIGIDRSAATVIVDDAVAATPNLVAGANRAGYHLLNTNHGRDYRADLVADLVAVNAGDPCPECGAPLRAERGVEVGNIFKLGTRYSERLGVGFLDEQGRRRPFVMGSYGIGPARLMACLAELHHDEHGPLWPAAVAPFDAVIAALSGSGGPEVSAAAEGLYAELGRAGLEVLLDDRRERPGVKFADADLIGAPWRVTVSARGLGEGYVELKRRGAAEVRRVALEEVRRVLQEEAGGESA